IGPQQDERLAVALVGAQAGVVLHLAHLLNGYAAAARLWCDQPHVRVSVLQRLAAGAALRARPGTCRVLRADDAGREEARERALSYLGRTGEQVGVGDSIVGQRGAEDGHRGAVPNVSIEWTGDVIPELVRHASTPI